MKLSVYDIEGKKTSVEVELNNEVFGIEPNFHLIHQSVKVYLANQRQGTAKAKGRSELAFSNKKLFRQKGTGGARRGDRKSPVLVGGGKTFGPSPRDYTMKMNKKQKLLARKSAYSDKALNDKIYLIDNFVFEAPKTTKFVNVLSGMEVLGKKVLVLVDTYSYLDEDAKYENTVNLLKSIRNIKNTNIQLADTVSTYEIMNADCLIIQKGALQTIDRVNG
ncbi:MAG: 50S ribosomal protein L4 [Candidatus Delongbacteria bacterium]|nr:50S ribosomal protein L4 [Candidatus Delongbacteria bacterium]MCG2760009.1 50S ribosomal protein L4 [Candidatus Delongbacteria bacterium]